MASHNDPTQRLESRYRVLILFAHPAFERSRVNRKLVEAVRDLEHVTFHDLYQAYPLLDIRVSQEQELLLEHDVVVLQHPFFWYSTPAILKEWQDLVLQHGWAYGSQGTALHGKKVLNAISTGGGESAYQRDGYSHHTIRELLAPISQSLRLCGMDYLPPFVAHGTLHMTQADIERHAMDYRRLIIALRDGTLVIDSDSDLPRINVDLDTLIREPSISPPTSSRSTET